MRSAPLAPLQAPRASNCLYNRSRTSELVRPAALLGRAETPLGLQLRRETPERPQLPLPARGGLPADARVGSATALSLAAHGRRRAG